MIDLNVIDAQVVPDGVGRWSNDGEQRRTRLLGSVVKYVLVLLGM